MTPRTQYETEAQRWETLRVGLLACLFILGGFAVAALFAGCSSAPHQHKVYGDAQPSFEIDDPGDGIFPNKSPRVGENVYGSRFIGGYKCDFTGGNGFFKDGDSFHVGAGMRNQHVGTIDIGFEKVIGHGGRSVR